MDMGFSPVEGIDVAPELASDAELISASRGGDRDAFSELYARHASAALLVARQHAMRPADAEDIVSESFARIFRLLQEGKGPDSFFRAYLFTSIRRMAVDLARSLSRMEEQVTVSVAEAHPDPRSLEPEDVADRAMVRAAFASLPERWRSILWYSEVEGLPPAQIAPFLGLSPNGTAALLHRAREGLRQAFLQQHISGTLEGPCRSVAGHLGAWARGALASRERGRVDAHLAECESCHQAAHSLKHINKSLRSVIAPAVLGSVGLTALLTALRSTPPAHGLTPSPEAPDGAPRTAGEAEKTAGGTVDADNASIQGESVSASPASPPSTGGVGASALPPLPATPTTAKTLGLLGKLASLKGVVGAALVGAVAISGTLVTLTLPNNSPPAPLPVPVPAPTHTPATPAVTHAADVDLPLVFSASGNVGVTQTGAALEVAPDSGTVAASSSADLELPSDARVSFALLQWANGREADNWTAPTLTGPDGTAHEISPESLPRPVREHGQIALAVVTSQVAAAGGGRWQLRQPAAAGPFAGWALVVAYSSDSEPGGKSVAVYAGAAQVEPGVTRNLSLDLTKSEVSHLGFVTWGASEPNTADGVWMTDLRSVTGLSQPLPSPSAALQAPQRGVGIDVFCVEGTLVFPHSQSEESAEALSFRVPRTLSTPAEPFAVGAVSVVSP